MSYRLAALPAAIALVGGVAVFGAPRASAPWPVMADTAFVTAASDSAAGHELPNQPASPTGAQERTPRHVSPDSEPTTPFILMVPQQPRARVTKDR